MGFDEVEDEFVADAVGVAVGGEAVAAASFFSPVLDPLVSPPVVEEGLSLSE